MRKIEEKILRIGWIYPDVKNQQKKYFIFDIMPGENELLGRKFIGVRLFVSNLMWLPFRSDGLCRYTGIKDQGLKHIQLKVEAGFPLMREANVWLFEGQGR